MHHEYSSYEVPLSAFASNSLLQIKQAAMPYGRIYLCWLAVVDNTCVNIKPLNLKKKVTISVDSGKGFITVTHQRFRIGVWLAVGL